MNGQCPPAAQAHVLSACFPAGGNILVVELFRRWALVGRRSLEVFEDDSLVPGSSLFLVHHDMNRLP